MKYLFHLVIIFISGVSATAHSQETVLEGGKPGPKTQIAIWSTVDNNGNKFFTDTPPKDKQTIATKTVISIPRIIQATPLTFPPVLPVSNNPSLSNNTPPFMALPSIGGMPTALPK